MSLPFDEVNPVRKTYFINESERDAATPANDVGKVPQLESDGKLSSRFLRNSKIFINTSEDISANSSVGVNLQGQIARAFRNWVSDSTNTPAEIGLQYFDEVVAIDTDKYLCLYSGDNGSQDETFGAIATVDTDTHSITFGTQLKITNQTDGYSEERTACKLDTDKFVVIWGNASLSDDVKYVVCTVSGTTITKGTEGFLISNYNNIEFTSCCQLGVDKFVFYAHPDGNAGMQLAVVTVSGTVASVGPMVSGITSFPSSAGRITMTKVATDKFFMLNSGNGYSVVCTVSGTTITTGTALSLSIIGGADFKKVVSSVSVVDNEVWTRGQGKTVYMTIATRTITIVSNETHAGDVLAQLFNFNGDVFDLALGSDGGLYKLTTSGGSIIRTRVSNIAIDNQTRVAGDGVGFLAMTLGGEYSLPQMSDNFIGYLDSAISALDTDVDVNVSGVLTGLSGLSIGARYSPYEGGWVKDVNGSHTAISETELLVK